MSDRVVEPAGAETALAGRARGRPDVNPGLQRDPEAIGEAGAVVPPRRSGRGYDAGLRRARPGSGRADVAAVLQISEEGVGQLADAKLIALDRIDANPDQPRRVFDEATIEELAASIRARGVLQPIRVRRRGDRFQVVAGERRLRAARLAGLTEVPAIVVALDDDQAYVDALIENVQREDLNDLDRAEALKRLRVALDLPSWEAVGAAIGVTRQTVYNLLNLADLPPPIQEDLRSGGLSEKHGRALHQLNRRPELQAQAYGRIVEENLSGEEALRLVRELRTTPRAPRVVETVAEPSPERDAAASTGPVTPSPVVASVLELAARFDELAARYPDLASLGPQERRELRIGLQRLERRIASLLGRLSD